MTEVRPTKESRVRATTRTKTAHRAAEGAVQAAARQARAAADERAAAAPGEHAAAPEPQTTTATEHTAANPEPGLGSEATPAPAPARPTKGARLLEMLAVPEGATLAVLCDVLGWQAHTVRAALTRLRQAGHAVERNRSSEGETAYRIASGQPDGAVGPQQVAQTEVTPAPTATPEAGINPVADAETASAAPRAPETQDGGAA